MGGHRASPATFPRVGAKPRTAKGRRRDQGRRRESRSGRVYRRGIYAIPVPTAGRGARRQLALTTVGRRQWAVRHRWTLPVPAISRRTERALPQYADGRIGHVHARGYRGPRTSLDASGERVMRAPTCVYPYRPRVEGCSLASNAGYGARTPTPTGASSHGQRHVVIRADRRPGCSTRGSAASLLVAAGGTAGRPRQHPATITRPRTAELNRAPRRTGTSIGSTTATGPRTRRANSCSRSCSTTANTAPRRTRRRRAEPADAFSSFRAGFDVRTRRLSAGADVPSLPSGAQQQDELVGSIDLEYDEPPTSRDWRRDPSRLRARSRGRLRRRVAGAVALHRSPTCAARGTTRCSDLAACPRRRRQRVPARRSRRRRPARYRRGARRRLHYQSPEGRARFGGPQTFPSQSSIAVSASNASSSTSTVTDNSSSPHGGFYARGAARLGALRRLRAAFHGVGRPRLRQMDLDAVACPTCSSAGRSFRVDSFARPARHGRRG